MVGDTGIEPVASSVSGKRAPAAPIAHVGGDDRNRTGDKGFAGPCLTAWPRRRLSSRAKPLREKEAAAETGDGLAFTMERKTGLEPATPTLARLCSTN